MQKRIRSPYSFDKVRGIQTLKRLSHILGEKADYLTELAIQKDSYYKPFIYKIPGKKDRPIDRPTGELLRIQTKIRDRLLNLVPLCKVTYGGVEGMSTKDNAQHHLRKDTLVKLDLRDCFHSSKSRMVRRLFKNRFGFAPPIADLLTELCTYQGHVPVGSTLSSSLVNHVLNPVWQRIDDQCAIKNLAFTTWVDDIAISGESAEKEITTLKRIINNYGFRISWNKAEILRSNEPQIVTGHGVNTHQITVPKRKRQEIIKALREDLSSPTALGMLNYAQNANSSQGAQLEKLRKNLAKTTGRSDKPNAKNSIPFVPLNH